MNKLSVSLGLSDAVKAETIAGICHSKTERVDQEITTDFAVWFAKALSICRKSSSTELRSIADSLDKKDDLKEARHSLEVLWHVYYISSHFRQNLYDAFGKEKTDATYAWARENLTTRARRSALYANMYKLSTFADFRNHLMHLDVKDHVTLVKLVDAITNTKNLVEGNPLHLLQLESTVACDQASLKDKVISSILPDPNAGIGELLDRTFKMIKDNINPAGKKETQTSDELCLELCASPCNILLMTVAACVAGSTGLLVFMVPLFAAWSAGTTISGMVKEHPDNSDLHNFLKKSTTTLLTTEYRPDLNTVGAVKQHSEEEIKQRAPGIQLSALRLEEAAGVAPHHNSHAI